MRLRDDVVDRTGMMVDADDQKVAVKEGIAARRKSLIGTESSGDRRKAAQPNSGPLGKFPAAKVINKVRFSQAAQVPTR